MGFHGEAAWFYGEGFVVSLMVLCVVCVCCVLGGGRTERAEADAVRVDAVHRDAVQQRAGHHLLRRGHLSRGVGTCHYQPI
jgi:hypothetical protein